MLDVEALSDMMAGLIGEEVEKALAPLQARIDDLEARAPVAGEKGDVGERGEPGLNGADGAAGKDGRGVKDLLIDRDGNLLATMDDGSVKSLGPVCGKDGTPGENGLSGKDGRDGITLDSFDAIVLDDDRTVELKFVSGDEERVASFKWPNQIYRGVYQEAREYDQGDVVTWAGSQWHCDVATKDKPGTDSWTLAVKKGRDGKDSRNG